MRIVEESLAGRHQGCVVARRYGIASSQLFGWRKAYREGRLRAGQEPGVSFLEARVVPDQPGAAEYDAPPGGGPQGRMEIVVRTGRRVIVGADVDAAALARVVAVLEGL
ncbi:transposase [Caenispirillum bisanense]|uniref:Transposase n=1 Tax=Caenispirillum bisanense TaxID=414052 RepID=A0A286H3M1_9PROT|nr:transposase [Caenispirillum bisanense]